MKYKVGDKVKIKTREQMEKEFGPAEFGGIDCKYGFVTEMEDWLKKNSPDRVLTILKVSYYEEYYGMEGATFTWGLDMIEYGIDEYLKRNPVTRADLLDFED